MFNHFFQYHSFINWNVLGVFYCWFEESRI